MTDFTLPPAGTGGSYTLRNLPSARSAPDSYTINGATLTIDQDIRYGSGGATTYTLSSITINASYGGNVIIDGRYVRLIPFTGGSGTITAGSTITCGSATGVVIGIYSSLTTRELIEMLNSDIQEYKQTIEEGYCHPEKMLRYAEATKAKLS